MAVATKKALDPIARHAQLVEELEHIAQLGDQDEVEAQKLRQAECPGRADGAGGPRPLAPLHTEAALAQARVDQIRGVEGAEERAVQLIEQREKVQAQIAELNERAAARKSARDAVLADIEKLVEEHLDAFIDYGRELSEKAHAAKAELTKDERLQRAAAAWQEAANYWGRLRRTHNGRHDRDFANISRVADFPVPSLDAILDAVCLPVEVQRIDETGDKLGDVIEYECIEGNHKGYRVEHPAGSTDAWALDHAPNYRRV